MPASDYVNRDNADLVDELYRRFQADPQSVEPTWRAFFQGFTLGSNGTSPAAATGDTSAAATTPGGCRGRQRR